MNLFELNNTFELEMNDLELRNDDDLGFNIFNDRNNFDDRNTYEEKIEFFKYAKYNLSVAIEDIIKDEENNDDD